MRLVALLVVILGIAALVFGIIFFPQASSAKQKVVDSLSSGVTLDNLNAKYDQVSGAYDQLMAAGMPSNDPQMSWSSASGHHSDWLNPASAWPSSSTPWASSISSSASVWCLADAR